MVFPGNWHPFSATMEPLEKHWVRQNGWHQNQGPLPSQNDKRKEATKGEYLHELLLGYSTL